MKLTVKLDFGCGREIKVGTFSEIGRDTAFEFAGEFLSSGLAPAPFRLRAGGGLKIYDRSGNMETFGLFDDWEHGDVRPFRRFAAGWMGKANS